jgi:hypothetical protein
MAVKSAADALKRWQAAMSSGDRPAELHRRHQRDDGQPDGGGRDPQAMQKYRDNVLESITSGRRERKLMQASVAVWKTNAVSFRRVQAGRCREEGCGQVPVVVQSNAGDVAANAGRRQGCGRDDGEDPGSA